MILIPVVSTIPVCIEHQACSQRELYMRPLLRHRSEVKGRFYEARQKRIKNKIVRICYYVLYRQGDPLLSRGEYNIYLKDRQQWIRRVLQWLQIC